MEEYYICTESSHTITNMDPIGLLGHVTPLMSFNFSQHRSALSLRILMVFWKNSSLEFSRRFGTAA
jgi:hypothetical protein